MCDWPLTSHPSPSQTFACACVFWHRFRIHYGKQDYPFSEAALTCLWFACKTEDTQKKSRDVACAAWNIANPKDQRTPDDKVGLPSPSGPKRTLGLTYFVDL